MQPTNDPIGNTPSTPEDHRRITQAARDRADKLVWLAARLDGLSMICREASKELKQLAEGS